jgi:hypothetical protein
VTKLELTLQQGHDNDDDDDAFHNQLRRPLSFPSSQLEQNFMVWEEYPDRAMALPSRQVLLLHEGAKTYINGRYMPIDEESLFGWNLQHIPAWHGRIQDIHVFKKVYATCWQEIMIDARLRQFDIASLLLERLMYGVNDDEIENIDKECLESTIMASPIYDPVGICAKALATRFAQEFGPLAVPCLGEHLEWYKDRMGHRVPVVVPQRVLDVLRRGGYFNLQRETMDLWFTEAAARVRPVAQGAETIALQQAMDMLKEAGCEDDVTIMFVKINVPDPVQNKFMCRYNEAMMQFHINEHVWTLSTPATAIALYVAQEHFDGRILIKLLSKWNAPVLEN